MGLPLLVKQVVRYALDQTIIVHPKSPNRTSITEIATSLVTGLTRWTYTSYLTISTGTRHCSPLRTYVAGLSIRSNRTLTNTSVRGRMKKESLRTLNSSAGLLSLSSESIIARKSLYALYNTLRKRLRPLNTLLSFKNTPRLLDRMMMP